MFRSLPALLFLLPFLALALGTPQVRAEGADDPPVDLETATYEVQRLENTIKSSRSVNDELLVDLDVVAKAYRNLEDPPSLELIPTPEDATEEKRDELEDVNRDREKEWERAKRRWERAEERFRDDAEDAFLDAFTLVDIDRTTDSNIREPVNIKAARILGATGNPDLARRMQRALEREILDARHEVSQQLLREAFAGLARLGSLKTLEWLVDDFAHTRSTPRSAVEQLLAAHEAVLLYPPEDVPGSLRHEIVEQFVRSYAGVESVARSGAADATTARTKIFWDQISEGVIKILQAFSGDPRDARGVSYVTVADFQAWFREHKSPREAPWTDEEEP